MDEKWIDVNENIKEIVSEKYRFKIEWTKNIEEDLRKLSRDFFDAAFYTVSDIVTDEFRDNTKSDMWFLPGVYMFRQALELLMKAGLAKIVPAKRELQDIFTKYKHNVHGLYKLYCKKSSDDNLSLDEKSWLNSYLTSLEEVDSSSDLFRYPFKEDFLDDYRNEFLDIVKMGNGLIYCYSTLNRLIYSEWVEDDVLDPTGDCRFLIIASKGVDNCYLWESPWSDGFFKQIEGYTEVAKHLFDSFILKGEFRFFFPVMFLLRNAIELRLKRMMRSSLEVRVEERIVSNKRNSHLLVRDLWKELKPILVHYSIEDNQDLNQLEIFEVYLKVLNNLDKKSDVFRYPFNFSFQYTLQDLEFDIKHFIEYIYSIIRFLDGCDAWLGNIQEFEQEMRSYIDF